MHRLYRQLPVGEVKPAKEVVTKLLCVWALDNKCFLEFLDIGLDVFVSLGESARVVIDTSKLR